MSLSSKHMIFRAVFYMQKSKTIKMIKYIYFVKYYVFMREQM